MSEANRAPTASGQDELPDRATLARVLEVDDDRALGLLRLLLARCRADDDHATQVLAVEKLGRFVVAGPSVWIRGAPAAGRLTLLVQALERVPGACQRVVACLGAVLTNTSAVRLFAEVGLPNDRGLLAETTDRLADRLLPRAPDLHDLAALAGRIFRNDADVDWLDAELDPVLARLAAVLAPAFAPLRDHAADAMGLIATRLAALGMAEQVRARSPREAVRDSPFYRLGRAAPEELVPLIAACRERLVHIRHDLEVHGVSVNLVYCLDTIERGLRRIERLGAIVHGDGGEVVRLRALIVVLGRGLVGDRSFRALMGDNLRLLARKVIERAGRTGEHYVTATRREYWRMLGSAAGGGVLTAGTAIAKFWVKWGQLPLFIDGVVSSVLYAASFLLIQALGFTLATKQPSMTAAALAGTLRDHSGADRLDELVRLITQISRSQFAAAMGNILAVLVVALGVDYAVTEATGAPFLDPATAHATVRSFDPLGSGTILFAALTGVLLWVASLAAGWFENWLVFRQLPAAIAAHRWGETLGRARMARIAAGLERSASGIGGSIALGFLLGMTPVFAKFFGLPLDVRHVTLSTGSLSLAMSSLGLEAVGWSALLWACAGIVIIGMLNFGVSFALALVVALRARDVPRADRRRLPGAVWRRFVHHPIEFFWPPKDAVRASTGAPH